MVAGEVKVIQQCTIIIEETKVHRPLNPQQRNHPRQREEAVAVAALEVAEGWATDGAILAMTLTTTRSIKS
jgi:hypothetical protein